MNLKICFLILYKHFTAPLLIENYEEYFPILSKLNYFSASLAISGITEKSSSFPKSASNFEIKKQSSKGFSELSFSLISLIKISDIFFEVMQETSLTSKKSID